MTNAELLRKNEAELKVMVERYKYQLAKTQALKELCQQQALLVRSLRRNNV